MSTIERPRAPEQRTIDVDVHDIDTRGRTVHGYAAVYDVPSEDLGGYRERIAPGAFADVLGSDVRALLNHDPNEVLGRTKSGTLRLFDEQRGLRFATTSAKPSVAATSTAPASASLSATKAGTATSAQSPRSPSSMTSPLRRSAHTPPRALS
jgi:phage head maturation protease